MTPIEIKLDGRLLSLQVEVRPGGLSLQMGEGQRIDVQFDQIDEGSYCARVGRRVFPVTIARSADEALWTAQIRGISYTVEWVGRDRPIRSLSAGEGVLKLTARMPGKVHRILLKPGELVRAHQGVLVVEAMKMQNEVRATADGRVKQILVMEGQTLNAGDPLAVIEPAGAPEITAQEQNGGPE